MAKIKGGYGFLIKWLIMLGDLLLLNILFLAAGEWCGVLDADHTVLRFKIVIVLLNLNYFFAVTIVPVAIYKPVMFIDKVVQRSLMLVSMHLCLFLLCLVLVGIEAYLFPNGFIPIYYIVLYVAFTLWRIFARKMLKHIRRKGKNYKNVIIIGAGKNGLNLYAEMTKDLAYGYCVHGFFDDNLSLKKTLPNFLGMTHEVEDYVLANKIDEIYCTLPNSQDEKIIRILNFAEKNMIRFYIVPEFSRYVKKRLDLESIESVPIMAVRAEPLQSPVNRFVKRAFDIVFSLFFIILIFPFVYLIFGIMIKLSSSGPIFFKQKRTGIYGKIFYCYKFRSMKPNRNADDKQAEKGDPRITRIGKFLRKSNIDEIPQFLNVLRGEMSIVGPRPHMLKHTELYSSIIDKYMVRHLIKPGITGWAQVNGFRGETKTIEQMEERVRHDVWYLENWNFLLDLKICFVTVLNMFKGEKNAY
jgi:putative colanic acid biosynthesis UDP-glucose lipid carrier transferase